MFLQLYDISYWESVLYHNYIVIYIVACRTHTARRFSYFSFASSRYRVATAKAQRRFSSHCYSNTSLGPRPFSNFFHTHAQQRGRGGKERVWRHGIPFRGSWNVNNFNLWLLLKCSSARAAITIIMNNEKH